jgi:hypothetical protein
MTVPEGAAIVQAAALQRRGEELGAGGTLACTRPRTQISRVPVGHAG